MTAARNALAVVVALFGPHKGTRARRTAPLGLRLVGAVADDLIPFTPDHNPLEQVR